MAIRILLALIAGHCWAADAFFLKDGTIRRIEESGSPVLFDVGRKCTDLWVAPNGSAIAFVTIERMRTPSNTGLGYEEKPIPEQTSIYIARRSEGFRPLLVASGPVVIDGREWSVLRNPALSPDGKDLYFSIPYTMTTSKVLRKALPGGSQEIVAEATNFCIVWKGKYSGALLTQYRHLPDDAAPGVSYYCEIRTQSHNVLKIGDNCELFTVFVNGWSKEHQAACAVPQR